MERRQHAAGTDRGPTNADSEIGVGRRRISTIAPDLDAAEAELQRREDG
ncbi:hypothetical protein [Saccharopolyspora pogona]|nr:hypothetical protein [Saccharopolyspora pogona]